MATATDQLLLFYPWLPPEVIEAYDDSYRSGDVEPWAVVRADSRYDIWFPGNKTDDGSVRYGEGQYAAVRESYRDVLRSINLQPGLFEERFTELMEGEVSPAEFEARVSEIYDRVISASDAIKQAFATANGFDTTVEGILASVLDPTIGDRILSQEISIAEITGAAAESGFQLRRDRVEQLESFGITLERARDVFQQAETTLPILDMLAARHADPDDDFNLEEFTQAEFFNDPFQNRRMRRLISQERSTFSLGPSARQTRGALTGLIQE